MGKDIGDTREQVRNFKAKTIYDIFFNKELPNHFKKDNTWVNFGENLMIKPKYVFSDDCNNPVGYLIYKNSKFHVENKQGDLLNIKKPEESHFFNSPISIDHLKAITKLAEKTKLKIKLFGQSHSWSPVHTTNGIFVDNRMINYYDGIERVLINPADERTNHPSISPDGQLRPTATCSPGITSGQLETHLWETSETKTVRYSMDSSTYEDVFTMAGMCFTSSHGTGRKTNCLSDFVVAMTFVTYNGEVIQITPHECPNYLLYNEKKEKDMTPEDVWRAAQVNLGAYGIVYEMTVVISPQIDAYFVTEVPRWDKYFADTDEARGELFRLVNEWDCLEFWHYPFTFKDKKEDIKIKDILFAKVTNSPYVFITKSLSNKPPPGYTIIEKRPIDFYSTLLYMSVGKKKIS